MLGLVAVSGPFASAASAASTQTPSFSAPTNYGWNGTGTVAFAGYAEPGSTVEIIDDAKSLGATVTTATGSWYRTVTSVPDGDHLVTLKATALSGATATS